MSAALKLEADPGTDRDELDMAICAIRYCIGRRSYAVADGCRWARFYALRHPWVREVLIRDLRAEVARCDAAPGRGILGDPQDEQAWREVLAELEAMGPTGVGGAQGRRITPWKATTLSAEVRALEVGETVFRPYKRTETPGKAQDNASTLACLIAKRFGGTRRFLTHRVPGGTIIERVE